MVAGMTSSRTAVAAQSQPRVPRRFLVHMLQAARADSVAALRALPGVTVVLRDAELKQRHETSRIWKESWLSAFFHKPCNHELFVLQSLNMEGSTCCVVPVCGASVVCERCPCNCS